MIISPYSFGAAAPGPLDAYTAGLWSAVSVCKLIGAYNGTAMSVRDTTTNAEHDIGWVWDASSPPSECVNAAAVAALLGANNGACKTWRNQFGHPSHGYEQNTGSQQPKVATAGTFEGKVVFDGTNDLLPTGSASGTPSAFTVFFRGKLRATTLQFILEHTIDYTANDAAVAYYDAGAMSVGVHDTSPAGYARSDFNTDYPNDNVHCWRFDRSQVTAAAMSKLFINGTAETRDANGDSGTLPAGNFAAGNWFMGARNGAVSPAQLDAHTVLIYESALSDGDVASISTIIAALP